MTVALSPSVPPDIKNASDEFLINRLESISAGERLALARRGSGKLAEALLCDDDARVCRAALDNVRLTEALVIRAIQTGTSGCQTVEIICEHSKWSLRREVQRALLCCPYTPPAKALSVARRLPLSVVEEILEGSDLPELTRRYLQEQLGIRSS
jgi:hypothetical protein